MSSVLFKCGDVSIRPLAASHCSFDNLRLSMATPNFGWLKNKLSLPASSFTLAGSKSDA